MKRLAAAVVLLATISACASIGGAGGSPSGSPGPSGPLAVAELELRLLDHLGSLWYCDPDHYPIAISDELGRARERWDEVTADSETYAVILDRLEIDPGADLSPDEQLSVYRTWKQLRAVVLEPDGDDRYVFDLLIEPDAGEARGTHAIGTIDSTGHIEVTGRQPSDGPQCPICLAAGTLIDTPGGLVAVESLREGDPVWTLDGSGRRIAGIAVRVGSAPVPEDHLVVHLVLDDGREAWVSPGHPLVDGGTVGSLRPGDRVGGAEVVSADLVTYAGGRTFDLLASGPTGAYWAGGILLGSTLAD